MTLGSFQYRPSRGNGTERGYLLLVLMLFVAALVIAQLAVAPAIKASLRRDKEEEMVHRGTQYARAVRRYFKAFGRYPVTLEALEDTNHVRFLRRRYKDPFAADGEWQVVHYGDVHFNLAAAAGTGSDTASQSQAVNITGVSGAQGFSSSGTQGFSLNLNSRPSTSPSGATTTGVLGQDGQWHTMPSTNSQSNSAQNTSGTGTTSTQDASGSGASGDQSGNSSSQSSAPRYGGGAIVGVASTSPHESLRVFGDKNHYKDWQFIYNPLFDYGPIISGPYDESKLLTGRFAGAALAQRSAQLAGQQQSGNSTALGPNGSSISDEQQPPQPPTQKD
jgi:hypothetical protein